jgi:alkaline phosphatase D
MRPSLLMLMLLVVTVAVSKTNAEADFNYPNITLRRIAFGSCHKKNGPWPVIDSHDPQVFLWTGDAIYPKKGVASVEVLEQAYGSLLRNEEYNTFRRDKIVLGTWDDHE